MQTPYNNSIFIGQQFRFFCAYLPRDGVDARAKSKGWVYSNCNVHRPKEGIARLLLEHGADAAAQSMYGWTPPLHLHGVAASASA